MTLAGAPRANGRDLAPAAARRWIAALGAAGAVAIAYFLAARLGLALITAPSAVAVFWPASGVAAGILIVSGRRGLAALVIGVVVGTIGAGSMSDSRGPLTSLLNGFWNAGEAVLAAWLLERWFGQRFTFSNLGRVVGFLAAAALATAVAAIAGAATLTLLHGDTTAPYWDVWRTWFLSSWVGLVVVAPLVIGLAGAWREPPSRNEWIEGVVVLGLTAVACSFTMTQQTGSWLSFAPSAFVLPLLLWLTARCQPTFAIAGAFVASITIISATTFGIGRFGDAAVPIAQRAAGARVAMMMVTIFTLVLAVMFARQKKAEESLRESKAQLAKERTMLARLHEVGARLWLKRDLREALDEILAGAIELLGADMGAVRILDAARGVLKIEAQRGFKQDYLNCFGEMVAEGGSPCCRALRSADRMVIENVEADEYFAPFRPLARAAGYRALQSTPILNRDGMSLGTLATHFRSVHRPAAQDLRLLDLYVRQAAEIIERHKAEDALRISEERLRLAQSKTGVGVWDWNLRTGAVACTPELEALLGLEPGTVRCYADFRDHVHPDDLEALEANREAALRNHNKFRSEFRIIRSDGEVRWLLSSGGAFYDEATGEPVRALGNNVDITERKQAELALAERNAQLTLAGNVAGVGYFTYDVATRHRVAISDGYAAIYGWPEGTTQMTVDHWRTRVHPDDLAQFDQTRWRVFANRSHDHSCDFRIFRADGQIRWIDSRRFVSYDGEGNPLRIIGVNIDVTERKQTEALLRESKARLSDALAAGQVVAFEWDAATGRSQRSDNAERILGVVQGGGFLRQVHPADRGNFNALIRNLSPGNPSYTLTFRFARANGRDVWLEEEAKGEFDTSGKLLRVKGLTRDITERRELEDHKSTLISELDHRVKNVLATVLTVASRTQETSSSMGEFVAALEGRIKSMAITHELLSSRHWQGIPLAELVRSELAPYATADNTRIDGPDVVLTAEAGQTLAMVFHELATNAAKFGALSVGSGRLAVRWNVWNVAQNGGSQSRLCIRWEESGGPNVVPPTRSGFGTSIVRELIPYELGGSVEPEYPSAGFRCKLEIPAHWITTGISPARRLATDHRHPHGWR